MNISTNYTYDIVQIHHDGALVAEMYGGSFEERLDRARVMAAAPDLYSIAGTVEPIVRRYGDPVTHGFLLAALAKARGEGERKARGEQ